MRIQYTYEFIDCLNKAFQENNIATLEELRRIAEGWMMPLEQRQPFLVLVDNTIKVTEAKKSYDEDNAFREAMQAKRDAAKQAKFEAAIISL
jgi:hypothetical protein